MDEWGHCALYVEAVIIGIGGGSGRLLTARIAADRDHVDNSDEPRSQKESEQAYQYTVDIISDLQRFDLIRVTPVILTPRP